MVLERKSSKIGEGGCWMFFIIFLCLTTIQNYDIKLFLFTELQDNCNSTWQNLPILSEDDFEPREREQNGGVQGYAIFKTARKLMPTSWRAIKCG